MSFELGIIILGGNSSKISNFRGSVSPSIPESGWAILLDFGLIIKEIGGV